MVLGVSMLAAGLLHGRVTRLKGMRACAYGAGMLVGLPGIRYEEYRQPRGSMPC